MSKLAGFVSLAVVGIFLQFASRSDAQTAQPSAQSASEQQKVCDRLSFPAQICARLERRDITNLDDPSSNPKSLAAVISPLILVDTLYQGIKSQEEQNALQLVSTNGNLTQTGSSASGSGSTNLVTKPTTTDFLSLASESGAFTDTVNGSTATVQANALGLVKYLRGVPIFSRWSEGGADTLQPLNFNASLSIAQSGSTVAPTSGSATGTSLASLTSIFIPSNNATLNSFGVTYAVYRRFNPQKKADSDAWIKAVMANKSQLQADVIAIKAALLKLVPDDFISSPPIVAALAKWHKDVAAANVLPSDQQFEALANAYSAYLSAYEKALLSQPNGLPNATAFLRAENAFQMGSTPYSIRPEERRSQTSAIPTHLLDRSPQRMALPRALPTVSRAIPRVRASST